MESKDNFEFPIDNSIPVTEWINFTNKDRQENLPLYIRRTKEVERMKQTLPVVHCIYTEAEKSLAELLEESFRLYLVRILATSEEPVL